MNALRPLVLAWGVLMLLLLAQIGTALLLHIPASASLFGLVAAGVVAVVFMRIRHGSALMHIFAVAGLFWLLVLLVLGTMDPLTRSDRLTPMMTDSADARL